MNFHETLERIQPTDISSIEACKRRWDAVAKPLHSLGLLEDLTARMAGIQRTSTPHMDKPCVLVFCADNGVVAEGISQSDNTVTAAVAESLADGCSNVNILARVAGADVVTYDVGMAHDVDHPQLRRDKLSYGTKNFAHGAAMNEEEAIHALEVGIHAAEDAIAEGCDLLVAGEMGIGNTTSSTAVLCALLGAKPEGITGRGSGLDDTGLLRKQQVIRRAIELNQPDPDDPLDVLRKLGGFDIAAMCGSYLGAAALGVPIVLDGLISGAAALLCSRFSPAAADALMPSHVGGEPGAKLVLEALNLRAPIHANLALGEGTGGVALLPLLTMALALLNGEHSFDSIGVEAYTPLS